MMKYVTDRRNPIIITQNGEAKAVLIDIQNGDFEPSEKVFSDLKRKYLKMGDKLKRFKDYRQLIESPWRIIYKIDKNIVNVLIIIDSRRNTQDILLERLIK